MALHIHILGIDNSSFPFLSGGIWVRWFFMVSGYFTCSHFSNSNNYDNYAKNAILYTLKKYLTFIPSVVTVISIYYLFRIISERNIDVKVLNILENVLLIDSLITMENPIVPLWYLSTMLWCLPVFCIICQYRERHITTVLIFTIYLVYYNYEKQYTIPLYITAFVNISIGIVIYEIVNWLNGVKFKQLCKYFITIFAGLIWGGLFYVTYKNCSINSEIYFFTGLIFTLTRHNKLSYVRNVIVEFLGKISSYIFIYHWLCGLIIAYIFFMANIENNVGKIFLYYIISFIFSICAINIEKWFKNKILIKRFLLDKCIITDE